MGQANGKYSPRLRKIFNATLLSLSIGCASVGSYDMVNGFTAATVQDFQNADACSMQAGSGHACTGAQVGSLLNIRDSFREDALGISFLMGGGLLFRRAREGDEKRKRMLPAPPAA